MYKNDGSISAISESNPTIKSTTISLEAIRRVQNGYFGRIEETKNKNLLLKAFIPIFYNDKNQTIDLIHSFFDANEEYLSKKRIKFSKKNSSFSIDDELWSLI